MPCRWALDPQLFAADGEQIVGENALAVDGGVDGVAVDDHASLYCCAECGIALAGGDGLFVED